MTTPLSSPHRLLLALPLVLASLAPAQQISPLLVGSNLWYAEPSTPTTSPAGVVMNHAGAVGLRLIRIGGKSFDLSQPSNAALIVWVDRIRAIGAEPIVQVSQYASAESARATVAALNAPGRSPVRYWTIGNEPWLQAKDRLSPDPTQEETATAVSLYFKARAERMKDADPTIKILGVSSEDYYLDTLHNRLFSATGAESIVGRVPGKTYYYCDGLIWHRYPGARSLSYTPALAGINSFRDRTADCEARINQLNSVLNRRGDDALVWAIGEFNSENALTPIPNTSPQQYTGINFVNTWENGQMFAAVYGFAMRHNAVFAASWSLRESQGPGEIRGPTDYSLLNGNTERPSYWHTQLVSQNFTGRYLEGRPSIADDDSELLIYGAADVARDRVSVMLLNRGTTERAYHLHLNSGNRFAPPGATALNLDARQTEAYPGTIPGRSTQVLVFRRNTSTRIDYAAGDFERPTPRGPTTAAIQSRPLAAPVDTFDDYTDLAQAGYWTAQHLNGGAASLATGKLVLRANASATSVAALSGQTSPEFNFFDRGFTLALTGFEQPASGASAAETVFRLSLGSESLRAFRAPDALGLRLTPTEARLGFKLDQPEAQPELRAGLSGADGFLARIPLDGAVNEIHLSLEPEPAGPLDGPRTIRYALRLDGAFGRIVRSGTFQATRSTWGDTGGDSALALESRRDSATAGPSGAFVEARIDAITRRARVLDDFDTYSSFGAQAFWKTSTTGTPSTAAASGGSARLDARESISATASLRGDVLADFNFLDRPLLLELRDLELTATPDLDNTNTAFRLSLSSTVDRSVTSPDSLALRLGARGQLLFGFKVDEPGANAEQRAGAPGEPGQLASLVSVSLGSPPTGVFLSLDPQPTSTPDTILVSYALRVIGGFGVRTYAGAFALDRTRWGSAGDSALMIEARRNASTANAASAFTARLGAVALTSVPDDLFSVAPRYASWRLREFSVDEQTPASAAISGIDAAPAGDGVSNLLKYALGLPPRVPAGANSLPSFMAPAPGGPVAFVHSERVGSELTYAVQASTDLSSWTTPVREVSRSASVDGWVDVVTEPAPPANSPRVFMRLRVTAP